MAAPPDLNLREVMIFLGSAGLVVPLMHRLRISPVLGFLIVGLIIGPFGIGRFVESLPALKYFTITDVEGVHVLAELGVMFLLFMIGLELSVKRLWSMRRLVFGLGGAQVLVTSALIAFLAQAFGNSMSVALVLGTCLALSSTAMVMQLLNEQGRVGSAVGRTSFAVLLMQDIMVAPILFLVGMLGKPPADDAWLAFIMAMTKAAITIGAILVVGRMLLVPVLRLAVSTKSRELFLAAVLLAVIATSAATDSAELSLALGSFLAGLLIAETQFHHQVAVDLDPFKGLLLSLFFVSVGLSIDLSQALAQPGMVALSVLGLISLKAGVLFLLMRFGAGVSYGVALETALLLAQAGEFALVVIGLASQNGLLAAPVSQFMLIVTGLSMLATPLLALLARRCVSPRATTTGVDPEEADADDVSDHIVIVGFGRVGRVIGDLLGKQEIPYVAVETDVHLIESLRAQGVQAYWGDATHQEILLRMGIERARALAITTNDPDQARRVTALARKLNPELVIMARARDHTHARALHEAGASTVVLETIEAGLQLGEAALVSAGVSSDVAESLVGQVRLFEQVAMTRA